MQVQDAGHSATDVAMEANAFLWGLGTVTFAIFPLALPGLLLFVVAPLALVAVAGALLTIPLVLPVWLARALLRGRYRRRRPAVPARGGIRTIAAGQSATTA